MRQDPPLQDGRSSGDVAIVAGIALLTLAFIGWFGYELVVGFQGPPANLDGPGVFRAYGCASCHVMSAAGGGGRGPNLHNFGETAAARASELRELRGEAITAADYAAESIIAPDDYIVQGFPSGVMRTVSLERTPLLRLLAFLLDRPETDPELLATLERIFPGGAGATQGDGESWPEDRGDAARGEALFRAPDGPLCSQCHPTKAGEPDRGLGPNLHEVGVNKPSYLLQSIREPNAVLVKGYESVVLTDGGAIQDGRAVILSWPTEAAPGRLRLTRLDGEVELPFSGLDVAGQPALDLSAAPEGVVTRHPGERLSDEVLEALELQWDEEAEGWAPRIGLQPSPVSLMPTYGEALTEAQVDDLVRYLLTLKPTK